MSELEVIDVDKMADVRSLSGQFYRKSEVDKKIQSLEYLCENYRFDCDNLAIKTDKLKKAGRSLRQKMNHQKYKRCMAMAKYWVSVSYQCVDENHLKRAEKHHYKWLELAEQFKEVK